MNIFITGSHGFIGQNLREYLGSRYNLFAPDRKELELLDEKAVGRYIVKNNVDVIIHYANKGGIRGCMDFPNTVEYNMRIFFNIIKNCPEETKIIYFGSGSEYAKHRNIHKIKEEDFGKCTPKDSYGFYKYLCNLFTEKSEQKIVNLRLFGVFGKYENYETRFMPNMILKNLFGLDMMVNQNLVMDYLYIEDLLKIVDYFIENDTKFKVYNIAPTKSIDLVSICNIINNISGNKSKIRIVNPGLNYEYTADNSRVMDEIGCTFTDYEAAIEKIFRYYKQNLHNFDKNKLVIDHHLSDYQIKKN